MERMKNDSTFSACSLAHRWLLTQAQLAVFPGLVITNRETVLHKKPSHLDEHIISLELRASTLSWLSARIASHAPALTMMVMIKIGIGMFFTGFVKFSALSLFASLLCPS